MSAKAPICPVCESAAVLHMDSALFYRGVDYGPLWVCPTCPDAYVGCHKGTKHALGTPAGKGLRAARIEAHAAFDPLWKRKIARDGYSKNQARKAGYLWLAEQMGIDVNDCHISHMNIEQCRQVVAICSAYSVKE